jgi:multiple sugar transport system substrate-binding protein
MRRALQVAVLAAFAVPWALGCGGGTDRATVLELWAMGREGEVVRQLLPGFEQRHPGVRVRVQQVPWSAAHEKLVTAFVGGAMPDVFQAGNTWLPELVALGAVAPLDDRIAASTAVARDDWFPGILDTNVIDGVTWGVPWYVDTRLLFYRRDLLAAAGWPEPPRTWTQWVEAMFAVTKSAPGRHAILLPLREWQTPVVLAFQLGAELLREGGRRANFRSPPVRDAFGFYLGFFRRGLAPRAGDTQVANVYQDFARGNFVLYPSGPWNLGEFARRLPPELADAWATVPMPAPDGTPWPGVSLAGGASLALFRDGPRTDLAWRLIEYLAEPAQQVAFWRLGGDLPARRSAWTDPTLAADARAAAFRVQLDAVRPTPKVPEWERIATKVGQHLEAAIRLQVTLEDALIALDRDVDAILEKRRWLLEREGR